VDSFYRRMTVYPRRRKRPRARSTLSLVSAPLKSSLCSDSPYVGKDAGDLLAPQVPKALVMTENQ